jgi:hypothetical protein
MGKCYPQADSYHSETASFAEALAKAGHSKENHHVLSSPPRNFVRKYENMIQKINIFY